MRRQDHVRHLEQRVVGLGRLHLQHVETGAGDPFLLQRLDQRRLGDGGATPGVDEDGVRLHLPEVLLLQEADRLGRGGEVHGDEVGAGQHLRQARGLHAECRDVELVEEGIEGHHAQAERPRALGYRAGDAAEGDEAQRLPQQARHLEELRPALGPAALAHHAVLLDGPAMGGEQQHHGVVGHLLDEGVGAVGDGNALLGGGGDVDVVDADACPAR